eukprot:403354886
MKPSQQPPTGMLIKPRTHHQSVNINGIGQNSKDNLFGTQTDNLSTVGSTKEGNSLTSGVQTQSTAASSQFYPSQAQQQSQYNMRLSQYNTQNANTAMINTNSQQSSQLFGNPNFQSQQNRVLMANTMTANSSQSQAASNYNLFQQKKYQPLQGMSSDQSQLLLNGNMKTSSNVAVGNSLPNSLVPNLAAVTSQQYPSVNNSSQFQIPAVTMQHKQNLLNNYNNYSQFNAQQRSQQIAQNVSRAGMNPSSLMSQNYNPHLAPMLNNGQPQSILKQPNFAQNSVLIKPEQNLPESLLNGDPTLQNIVATCNFGCKLDLRQIALNARNCEYNPKRFAAAIMRIREPKTTALIFQSGKMVCTGAKDEEKSRTACKQYAKAVRKIGFNVQMKEFKIQNVVASHDCGFPISLEGLSNEHDKFSTYEPELFPGLIYRMASPKLVMLIFASGKIVFTGAKTREQIRDAYRNIDPVLRKHKKKGLAAEKFQKQNVAKNQSLLINIKHKTQQ